MVQQVCDKNKKRKEQSNQLASYVFIITKKI